MRLKSAQQHKKRKGEAMKKVELLYEGKAKKVYTTEETFRVQAEEGDKEAEKEVYGVGIEKGDGTIFWFHERIEESQ